MSISAMKEELRSGILRICSRWICHRKEDYWKRLQVRKVIDRNEARVVAQEYTLKDSVDYTEVFALALRITALRILLSIESGRRMSVKYCDIDTVFRKQRKE